MKRGNPKNQIVNKQKEVDKGKRRLLAGVATIAGAGTVITVLSQSERAFAAAKNIAKFQDRSKSVNPTNFLSVDTQITTQSISQGQPGTLQETPTPDATVAAAQKDLVIQQDQKAQIDNRFALITDVLAPIGTILAVGTLAYTIYRGRKDQKEQEKARIQLETNRQEDLKRENDNRRADQSIEQQKRDEARFQEAVLALGDKPKNLGAATTLRTFLQKEARGYNRFYQQIFDLSVGFLRLRKVDQDNPESDPFPDPFYREIIRLFCESAPLLREELHKETKLQQGEPGFENDRRKFFNASYIYLEKADLIEIDLSLAYLVNAYFNGAYLVNANLNGADLEGANPEEADSLKGTKMWNVINYSDKKKVEKCKAKGATFDPPPDQSKTISETK